MKTDIVVDKIENLVLLSLDAQHHQVEDIHQKNLGGKGTTDYVNWGRMLGFDTMMPKSAYSACVADKDDRVFTTVPELLLQHPADILGDETEFMLFNPLNNNLNWLGFRKTTRRPRGLAHLGKASCYYEFHQRTVGMNGTGQYASAVIGYDKSGRPMVMTFNDRSIDSVWYGTLGLIAASAIEDAHRPGTMLASVKDATEIKFPVPLDNYKHIFADRDAPMVGNRRKAILHWVAKHLRKKPDGGLSAVKRHTRGVEEFVIDGITVRIATNDPKETGVIRSRENMVNACV